MRRITWQEVDKIVMDEDVYILPEPDYESLRKSKKPSHAVPPKRERTEKSPAVAFSLSLFFWGGGQIYNRQYEVGLTLLILMLGLLGSVGAAVFFRADLASFLISRNVQSRNVILGVTALYGGAILFWLGAAVHAYFGTYRLRHAMFRGSKSVRWPFLGSLFLPGWGQFINGQPVKGVLFLICSLTLFFTVPVLTVTPLIWSLVEDSADRIILDRYCAAALLCAPVGLVVWLWALVDAVRSSGESLKKKSMLKRFRYAMNRVKMQGIIKGLCPRIRTTIRILLCFMAVLTAGYYLFPKEYYLGYLRKYQYDMRKNHMTATPELIEKVIHVMQKSRR